MKRILNSAHRQLTFRNRSSELLQKAQELSILCDAGVALIVFSSSGRLFEYAGSRRMQEIIQAYVDTHEEKPVEPSFHDYQDEIKRLKEEVQRLQKEERRKSGDMDELKLLSMMELENLEDEITSELDSVRQMKDLLIGEQRKECVRKEQELLEENESLRNELKRVMCEAEEAETISTCSSYYNTMTSVDSHKNEDTMTSVAA